MTLAEAQMEATRRWGRHGAVEIRANDAWWYVVGTKGAAPDRVAYGVGESWEEAFADADGRAS